MASFNWTNESIFELIRMVEKKPELWDTSSKDFRNKEKKHEAWLEIANSMNTQVSIVEKKAKMLVGQYRRELCRKRNSKWFAFQRLSFLGTRQIPVSLMNQQRPTHFVSVEQDRVRRIRNPNHQSAELRLEKPTVKDRMNIIKQREHKTEEKDEYTTYGELVAMKLKKIKNVYARSTAQYHINNILYRAEIGEFDKPRKENKSYSAKEHFTAENSSANVDLNDDADSSRSSSTKSMDYDLKLEESDDDIS